MVSILGSSWPLSTVFFVPCAYVLATFGWEFIYLFSAVCYSVLAFVLFFLYPSLQQEQRTPNNSKNNNNDNNNNNNNNNNDDDNDDDNDMLTNTLIGASSDAAYATFSESNTKDEKNNGDDNNAYFLPASHHHHHHQANDSEDNSTSLSKSLFDVIKSLSNIEVRTDWSIMRHLLSDSNCVLLYVSSCFPRMVPFLVQTVIPLWFSEQYNYSIRSVGWTSLVLCAGELTAVVLNVWFLKSQKAAVNVVWNQALWAVINGVIMAMAVFWTGDYLLGPVFAMAYLYLTFVFWEQTFVMNAQLLQQTIPETESSEVMHTHTQLYFFFCQLTSSIAIYLGPFLWKTGGLAALAATSMLFELIATFCFFKLKCQLQE
ncbi:hypothetical protein RFI_35481 [Reticulomyxa filosa]|uniref:Uncharacterized protein n=1 Tax=Reticulomyxa filosa TaxID=46433 RepID=X6LMM0_RETFI|nr:hypothetical protein RFI_35481 [Reticulomyxa filosa]|eukprot:ETO01960.1 hypothetical protein RFI_35481 [Reticulomyxa filosa]